MRYFAFALSLCLGTAAIGFEIEDSRTYPSEVEVATLRILSTADIDIFGPILTGFQAQHPGTTIVYDVASSTQVMQAIYDERIPYDLVISSAMDLQIKLANDGLVQTHASAAVDALPAWTSWRGEVFGFTSEPAVLVVSENSFVGHVVPRNRADLIALLRNAPEAFDGRIGTYDARRSGLGYLFATQDARNTESFWQLTEIMGGLNAQLYCCSGEMITDVAEGRLAIAYNVLGSYAEARVAETPGLLVIEMDDYISVMMRTVVMPKNAPNPDVAGLMIDFLLSPTGQDTLRHVGLSPVMDGADTLGTPPRTIRLGPGLLVFLDQLRRDAFLRNWTGSIVQN